MGDENTILSEPDARHLLRRAGFGATRAELDRSGIVGLSRGNAADRLLGYPPSAFKPKGRDQEAQHNKWINYMIKAKNPAQEKLVHHGREAEHIGPAIPDATADALGRGVGPAHRRRNADALERTRHAKANQTKLVCRHEDIARMQRPVQDLPGRSEVEGVGQRGGHPQHVDRSRRAALSNDDVERLCGDVVLRQVGLDAVDAGRKRRGNHQVSKIGGNQLLELANQLMDALGRQVQAE